MKIINKLCLTTALVVMLVAGVFSVTAKAATLVESQEVAPVMGADNLLHEVINDSLNGDPKWYEFTTSKDTFVTIALSSETDGSCWGINLYDSKKHIMNYWARVGINRSSFESGRITLGDNEKFYLEVSDYGSSANGVPFTLSVSEAPLEDFGEREPNSSFKGANDLGAYKNHLVWGSIWNDYHAGNLLDVDYYKYTMTKDGQLYFRLDKKVNYEVEWKVTLYDSKKNVISDFQTNKEKMSIPLSYKKGTVLYAKVEGINNARGANYTLRAIEKKNSLYESETNDTMDKATVLKNIKKGYIYGDKDVDYYCYKATGKKVNITFSVLDRMRRSVGWKIEIYKGTVKKANRVLSKTLLINKKISIKTKAGTDYYIILKSAGTKKAGHDVVGVGYSLKVSK